MVKENRIVYLDILRIVAIFAVIMIHVSASGFCSGNLVPRTFEWHVHAFYDAIARFGVPVFVMITGALYGDPLREVSITKLFRNNIPRLACALFFWYVAFLKFHAEVVVLWYCFLCISIYMMIPFLRMVTGSYELTKYFVVLALIFSFALPQIFQLPIWNGGGTFIKAIRWVKDGFYGNVSYHLGFGYYSYFVIGYICSKIKLTKSLLRKVIIIGVCGFVYTVLMTEICSYVWAKKYDIFMANLSLNVLAEAIFVFIFCRWITEKVQFEDKILWFISAVGNLVFGVYLVHLIVLNKLEACIRPLGYNPIWMDVVLVLVVFCISCVISALIHKIPVLKKYIV